MIAKGKQLSKRSRELTAEFRQAYFDLNKSQKEEARRQFCELHRVTEGTFRNKVAGTNPVSQTETNWMTAYNPYAQPVAA